VMGRERLTRVLVTGTSIGLVNKVMGAKEIVEEIEREALASINNLIA
jgi:hypothetical protein